MISSIAAFLLQCYHALSSLLLRFLVGFSGKQILRRSCVCFRDQCLDKGRTRSRVGRRSSWAAVKSQQGFAQPPRGTLGLEWLFRVIQSCGEAARPLYPSSPHIHQSLDGAVPWRVCDLELGYSFQLWKIPAKADTTTNWHLRISITSSWRNSAISQNGEKVNVCCLNHLAYGTFFMAALTNSYTRPPNLQAHALPSARITMAWYHSERCKSPHWRLAWCRAKSTSFAFRKPKTFLLLYLTMWPWMSRLISPSFYVPIC